MKKLTALLIAALMIFTLVSCGGEKTPKTSNNVGEVISDVELLDFAENRIGYLFAPEGFVFDEISGEGGYNSGRNHILYVPDDDYEIEVGLIAAYDSILYDLFLNGTLTKTFYNGMEFDSDDVYELTVKEELDFEYDGHKVYYVERTINDGYPSNYVLFEHIDDDELAGLYGVELYSDNTDFYTRENCVKTFKEVFGIGRTESADYFENEVDEDDEDWEDTYGTLESVEMVYGSDELPVTIYKPANGTLELDVDEADDDLDYVWVSSDDFEWNIDVFSAVSYDVNAASCGFVDYYYKGELHPNDDDYDAFEEEVYQLDVEYMGKPVMVIKYTFTEAGEDYEDTEYFVGVEFEDTYNGERYGDGLLGFKYYMYDQEPALEELGALFCEIFGV